jgi:hypothetical protein
MAPASSGWTRRIVGRAGARACEAELWITGSKVRHPPSEPTPSHVQRPCTQPSRVRRCSNKRRPNLRVASQTRRSPTLGCATLPWCCRSRAFTTQLPTGWRPSSNERRRHLAADAHAVALRHPIAVVREHGRLGASTPRRSSASVPAADAPDAQGWSVVSASGEPIVAAQASMLAVQRAMTAPRPPSRRMRRLDRNPKSGMGRPSRLSNTPTRS